MRDRTPNVCLLLALAISAASIQAAARSTWAADRADLAFLPTSLAFEGVASGDSAAGAVVVHNGGVDTIMVASTYFAAGGQSPFSVWPEAFGISPGDTVQLNVVYKPAAPGSWTDVLLLGASAVGESLLPAPGVGLSGRGAGQALQAVPGQLQFASSMVGVTDTATVLLRSVGGDTVRIRGLTFSDSRFSTGTDSLDLAPGEDRELAVVYTPSTGTSVSGAMSFDLADSASVPIVSLDAAAAAVDAANARISLVRLDSLAYPAVGDTVSVRLDLRPGGDSVDGVEVYLSYDSSGLSASVLGTPVEIPAEGVSAAVVANRTLSVSAETGAIHYALLLNTAVSSDRTIGTVQFVVTGSLPPGTWIRVMNEPPGFNSYFSSPSLGTRSLPGLNRVVLGNAAPIIKPFPLLDAEEDRSANIALSSLAYDAETSAPDLIWTFTPYDESMTTRVDEVAPELGGRIARFIPDADRFGVYAITATVEDAGGARDTALVVVDIVQTNDAPLPPKYQMPADQAEGLVPPILFRWTGDDPDPFDSPTYIIELGIDEESLDAAASGLTEAFHELPAVAPGVTIYWRVISSDGAGVTTAGAIRSFTSAPDTDPPGLQLEPTTTSVGETTAVLTWRTDELTQSLMRYGPSSGFTDSVGVAEQAIDGLLRIFNVEITGLKAGMSYSYEVRFEDAAGNVGRSEVGTFETSPGTADAVGDFDGDLRVTFDDFIQFAGSYSTQLGEPGYDAMADFDGNGLIDFTDFISFAAVYGDDYTSSRSEADS